MFQFFKVRELPANPRPNCFYYVAEDEDQDFTDAYLTDKEGVPKAITNRDIIDEIVLNSLSEVVTLVVNDIAERNTLVLTRSQLVYVEDASDDPQVSTGDALYMWNPNNSTWNLVSANELVTDSILDGGNF